MKIKDVETITEDEAFRIIFGEMIEATECSVNSINK